jgi:FecR protein
MRWHRQSVVAMVLMASLIVPSRAMAQGAVTATLSVLAAPVERIAGDAGLPEPGISGMNLAEGDRIRTGAGGVALITFLNGSTVTLASESEVTVKQAPTGRAQAAGIRMLIHAGRVWARVAQAAGSRSTLTLESNDYSATAHDGLIGAEQSSAGTFVCWTRRGTLWLTDRSGQTDTVLVAGQRARARFGMPATPEPFVAGASALEIRTTGPVLPLVRMPDGGSQSVGFLAPDVEVNQVFGSLTGGKGQRWVVEVPGGHEGPYTLILTGTGTGPFTARISARYLSFTAYRQDLRGEARPGERLFTRITQTVKGQDPRTARALEASVEGLRAWDPSEPAAVVASPSASPGPDGN